MCQTLIPQSECRQCGLQVTFEGLPDPCHLVRDQGVPFASCENHSIRTILGPPLCNSCRYRSDADVVMSNTGLLATESAPVPFLPALPVISHGYSAGAAHGLPPPPPGMNPPFRPRSVRRSATPVPVQVYNDSPGPMSGVSMRGPLPARDPTPLRSLSRHGSRRGQPAGVSLRERYGLPEPVSQVRTPGFVSRGGLTFVGGGHPISRLMRRSRTRRPTPYATRIQNADEVMLEHDEDDEEDVYEEEEEEQEESSDSSGGAALPDRPSTPYAAPSVISSWSTTQPSSSRQRMALPGVSPIFVGFGHTAPRAPPPNTPAYGTLLPDLSSPTDGPEAWIPASWASPVPLAPEVASALEVHQANSYFRGHRVYFVTSAGAEVDTVLVVTPDRRRVRVLEAGLYRATAREIDDRETALREALARTQREQQAEANRAAREERLRQRMGPCIHFPCRDAGCDRAHAEGQQRPLTPSQLAAFFQANMRVGDAEGPGRGRTPTRAPRAGGSRLRRVSFVVDEDDVSGSGAVVDDDDDLFGSEAVAHEPGEDEENVEPVAETMPPRASLQPTVEDGQETPSPLQLTFNDGTGDGSTLQPPAERNDEQETPSTLHLSTAGDPVVRNARPQRAPRQLVERAGQVQNRLFRDLTQASAGSPPPRSARTHIPAPAQTSRSSGSGGRSSSRVRSQANAGAAGAGGGSSSSAQKLLSDNGPGLGDLVIPPKEDDDIF